MHVYAWIMGLQGCKLGVKCLSRNLAVSLRMRLERRVRVPQSSLIHGPQSLSDLLECSQIPLRNYSKSFGQGAGRIACTALHSTIRSTSITNGCIGELT